MSTREPHITRFSVPLPDEIAHAVDGEAHRRMLPQKQVIAEFFLRFWPVYQALRLSEDFSHVWSPDYDVPPWAKGVVVEGVPGSTGDATLSTDVERAGQPV